MRFLLLLLPLVFLTACGGSRSRVAKNERCKPDFLEAHKMSVKGHKKVDLDAPEGEVASANLALNSTALYVYDKSRDIRLHITQYKKADSNLNSYKINCSGGSGIQKNMKAFVLNVPVFDQVVIDESGKTNFSIGSVTIDLRYRSDKAWLNTNYEALDSGKDKSGSLKKAYESYKDVEQFYFNGKSKQIRNSMNTEVDDPRNSSKSEVIIKTVQNFKDAAEI